MEISKDLDDVEVWADIKSYEGIYQVSNFGRVKSVASNAIRSYYINNNGYHICGLYKNCVERKILIHREVARSFIENPYNKPCVNHKNGIRTDNRVENLEWCTHSENNIHSHKQLNRKRRNFSYPLDNRPQNPVFQYTLDRIFIREFASCKEAATLLNLQSSKIHCCRSGTIKSYGGFLWRRKRLKERTKILLQLDADGLVINEWDTISDACKSLNLKVACISGCCRGVQKTHGGFRWKYKNIKSDETPI